MLKSIYIVVSLCCINGFVRVSDNCPPVLLGIERCIPPVACGGPGCASRWYYDADAGRCALYDSGDNCGNVVGFYDPDLCLQMCERYAPCLRDPTGPGNRCDDQDTDVPPPMPREYIVFDRESMRCKLATEYGCGVPRDHFDSIEHCEEICLGTTSPPTPTPTPVPGRCVEFAAHHCASAQAQAERTCDVLPGGGALATIESWAEYERVKGEVQRRRYWIGGRFKCPDCKYDWINCTTHNGSVITSWEIEHIPKVSHEKAPVCLLYDGAVHKVAKANCTERHPFICERPCSTSTTASTTTTVTTPPPPPPTTPPPGSCSCVATDDCGHRHKMTAQLSEDGARCHVVAVGKEEIFSSTIPSL